MSDVTRILSAIEKGDPRAADQLLPLVYDELRKLAADRMLKEKPGQTLQATALVHEAYLRLVASPGGKSASPGRKSASPGCKSASPGCKSASPGRKSGENEPRWTSRGHFFAAAAEAMRRILIDRARRKRRPKHGGDRRRVPLDEPLSVESPADDLLALDDALTQLAREEPAKAELIKLRYFGGLSLEEAGACLGISFATAKRYWSVGRAWLFAALTEPGPTGSK